MANKTVCAVMDCPLRETRKKKGKQSVQPSVGHSYRLYAGCVSDSGLRMRNMCGARVETGIL